MEKTIKWQGIQDKTLEVLTIRADKEGFRVSSNIHGTLGEERINLNYQIVLDQDWRWQEFRLRADGREVHHLVRNEQLAYRCPYLDFCLTPFTNALPIRKENLEVSGKTQIDVLYICYPEQELKTVKQEYERTAERTYKFKDLSTGFEAVIQVDDDGMVTAYPSLFDRVE